jgi:hypothetical protein
MNRVVATIIVVSLMLPAAVSAQQSPASGFSPAVRAALMTGMVYSFAVSRNGDGYCLPPNDAGLDVVWKTIADDPEMFADVKVEPNRLPERAYLGLLRKLFPCR